MKSSPSISMQLFLLCTLFACLFSTQPLKASELDQQEAITATVRVKALNIRSGPGKNYNRIGGAKSGEKLTVLGQARNCSWLQIRTAQNLEGWVAATAQYVQISVACTTIPALSETSLPTNVVTTTLATQPSTPNAMATPSATATPLPPSDPANPPTWLAPGVDPARAAELEAKVPLKAGMACVLFQNFMGGILHISLNNHNYE